MASITVDMGLAEADGGGFVLVIRTSFREQRHEWTKGPFDTEVEALEEGQRFLESLKSEGYVDGPISGGGDA